MKRQIFTLLLVSFISAVAFAQKPSVELEKATTAPVIDGVVDEVWALASAQNIDLPFQAEVPTLGNSGETTWQALWTNDGIYVLLTVTDDAFYPHYSVTPAGNSWEYDKPEIYFDVNYVLEDGVGAGGGAGHYQVAPAFADGSNDGTAFTDANSGVVHAFMVTAPNYIAEYFIPFSWLVDKDGIGVDKQGQIGFDVTIIDRDPGDAARKRAVWANIGGLNESYNNMDDCGIVTLKGADAAILIESIALTGGSITEDNGTLQIEATILPDDADNKNLKWSVEPGGTGKAKVSSTGLVTGVSDGVVTIKAEAMDGSYEEATCEVTISGQLTTLWELNVIRNGLFDLVETNGQATYWGGWGGDAGSPLPQIVEGVAVATPVLAANNWQYQFNQSNLTALPNVDYIFGFVAWADADRTFCVDFEDIPGNNYNRYGATSDPRSGDGRSEWTFDVTMEPAWYIFDVNFDQVLENTVQKVQYMLGLAGDICYIDSVLLVTAEEYNTVSVPSELAASKVKVYPNPVSSNNMLNVIVPNVNSRISIYDSVGRKVEQVVATSEKMVINVSSYARGIYFVKVDNEPVVKFIK